MSAERLTPRTRSRTGRANRPERRFVRWTVRLLLLYVAVGAAAIGFGAATGISSGERAEAPVGLAPDPAAFRPAVVQVYAARTWGQKHVVSVHTWISLKPEGADRYSTFEIIGWRLRRTGTALVVSDGAPDRPWYGNAPILLADVRGDRAQALIPGVLDAIAAYPYQSTYRIFPGPNSNTFTAFVGRRNPGLGLDLPPTAIGKDYQPLSNLIGLSPGGYGVQLSLLGLAGITLGVAEGLELNVLGLNIEFDPLDLAVELPGIGRIGPPGL